MGYTASQAKTFIERMAPLMKAEAEKRGYAIVSTAIAQAVIEGAAGTSLLARNYHNHFGLKCGKAWKGASVNMRTKEEYKVGTLTTIKDNFRAYASDEEGVKGYYDFISTSRYANLKTASSPEEYARMLKADGYATSSSYVNTLISTVNKYDLRKYDPVRTSVGKTYPILKKGSRGDDVRVWQQFLRDNGYNISIDGVFGNETRSATLDWQVRKGLIPDGEVGSLTRATMG